MHTDFGFLKRFICLVEVHNNTVNYTQTLIDGEREQRLKKLAQYNHHLAVIRLLQYCVITNQSWRIHLVGDENLKSMNISIVWM